MAELYDNGSRRSAFEVSKPITGHEFMSEIYGKGLRLPSTLIPGEGTSSVKNALK